MELNLRKIKKGDGEIVYLFAAIVISFFIIIYISIIVMTTNYFNIEYYVREIANRISVKSLISKKDLSNKNNLESELEYELLTLKKNINSKHNKLLESFFRKENFKIKELNSEKYENFKLFEIEYFASENYKIGGIMKYRPKALAYIFIALNEKIRGDR